MDTKPAPVGLNQQMAAAKQDMMTQIPASTLTTMAEAGAALAASGIAGNAVGVGDVAPDFSLEDTRGKIVRLGDLLASGPVVLSFFRGGWCPYCSLEMQALKHALGDIRARGAALVAISPQTPEANAETDSRFDPGFPLLLDPDGELAGRYGLLFSLDPSLIPIYRDFGIDLETANGNTDWRLPIPATYVLDMGGVVRAAVVDPDYTRRMEPADILAALDAL